MNATAAVKIDQELFEHVAQLPLDTRFKLGAEITDEQQAFLDRNGYLIFDQVVRKDEVDRINAEVDGIVEQWIEEGRKEVFGVPIFEGQGSGWKAYAAKRCPSPHASRITSTILSEILGLSPSGPSLMRRLETEIKRKMDLSAIPISMCQAVYTHDWVGTPMA